jgi:ATP phosphoribosyltransferase regulatory subunit
MGRYGRSAPATGFAFNVLNLLQVFEKGSSHDIGRAPSFLIFNLKEDKSVALELASALRQKGYPVTRDIIRREFADSLEYSKLNGIQYAVVIGEQGIPDDEVMLVTIADGARRNIKTRDLYADASLLL